jgi:hypothetical protein
MVAGELWVDVITWRDCDTREPEARVLCAVKPSPVELAKGSPAMLLYLFYTLQREGESYRAKVTQEIGVEIGRNGHVYLACPGLASPFNGTKTVSQPVLVCGRRCRILYLPPVGGNFACRYCHQLTYDSCRSGRGCYDVLLERIAANRESALHAMNSKDLRRLLARRAL